VGVAVFLLPTCFLVVWTALPFVAASWRVGESSSDPGGLPAYWLLKAAIPLGFGLLALQGLSHAVKLARTLRRGEG